MMTVIYKPMRRRRWMRIEAGNAPPTWKTFPMHDKGVQGSAKPGRGGRRKRKADRAKIRARIGAGVERKGWPLTWTMRRLIAWPTLRVRPLTTAQIAALASSPIVLPPGLEFQYLEPKRHPGRRERRRRAKLRRRREMRKHRRSALYGLKTLPGIWRPDSIGWALVNRCANALQAHARRTSPTPGA